MAKFIKSALKVGETFIDGNGKPVPVTTERLRHFSNQFGRLTKAGYIVPVAWDHADTLEGITPLSTSDAKKRSAANTIGRLDSFAVAKDGKSAEVTLKITDPKAQGRAERNEVYISPVIMENWRDGKGQSYSDSITHVDFVNHPVDHSQGPFQKLPETPVGSVALAIRMGLDKVCTFMGDSPFEKKDDDETNEADEGNDSPADDAGDTEALPEAEPANPDIPVADDKSKNEALVACISELGGELPSDFTLSHPNALDLLLTVFKTLAKSKPAAEATESEDEGTDSQVKVTDPGGFQGMSLPPSVRAAIAHAERQHQDSIKVRLAGLLKSGRCTPAEFQPRESQVGVVKLSLGPDEKPLLSDLEKWIDSREAVPEGTFWDDKARTQHQKLSLVNPPSHMGGQDMSEEEIQAKADWALGKR